MGERVILQYYIHYARPFRQPTNYYHLAFENATSRLTGGGSMNSGKAVTADQVLAHFGALNPYVLFLWLSAGFVWALYSSTFMLTVLVIGSGDKRVLPFMRANHFRVEPSISGLPFDSQTDLFYIHVASLFSLFYSVWQSPPLVDVAEIALSFAETAILPVVVVAECSQRAFQASRLRTVAASPCPAARRGRTQGLRQEHISAKRCRNRAEKGEQTKSTSPSPMSTQPVDWRDAIWNARMQSM